MPPILPLAREKLAGDITALRMKLATAKGSKQPVLLTWDEAEHLAQQLETYAQVLAGVERMTAARFYFLQGGGEG